MQGQRVMRMDGVRESVCVGWERPIIKGSLPPPKESCCDAQSRRADARTLRCGGRQGSSTAARRAQSARP